MKILDIIIGKKYYINVNEEHYYILSQEEALCQDMLDSFYGRYKNIYKIKITDNGKFLHEYKTCKIYDHIGKLISGFKVKFEQHGEDGPVKMVFRSRNKSFATKLKLKIG